MASIEPTRKQANWQGATGAVCAATSDWRILTESGSCRGFSKRRAQRALVADCLLFVGWLCVLKNTGW
jgi:hypothetical protein